MAEKPRILQGTRDMVFSIIPLVLICLVVAWASGNCTGVFSSDADQDKYPAADAPALLKGDAEAVSYPVRMPAGDGVTNGVPQGWKANSGSRNALGSTTISTVGYVTSGRQFVQLSQSNASDSDVVFNLFGHLEHAQGTIPVGLKSWTVYGPSDGQSAWVLQLPDVVLALYGRAPVPDFQTLAAAVQDAPTIH